MRIKIRNQCCRLCQHTLHALLQNGQQSLFTVGVLCINKHTWKDIYTVHLRQQFCVQKNGRGEEKSEAIWSFYHFHEQRLHSDYCCSNTNFYIVLSFGIMTREMGFCGGKTSTLYGCLRCKLQVGPVDKVDGGIMGNRSSRG